MGTGAPDLPRLPSSCKVGLRRFDRHSFGDRHGLFSFIKEAGEKLFGRGTAQAAQPDPAAANAAAAQAIKGYIAAMNLSAEGLAVVLTVPAARSLSPRSYRRDRKKLLCCGNVAGVAAEDKMTAAAPADVPQFYSGQGRYPAEDRQAVLRQRQQLHEDFRGKQTDADAPGQDLSGQMLRVPK
jgi:hypothetical protein